MSRSLLTQTFEEGDSSQFHGTLASYFADWLNTVWNRKERKLGNHFSNIGFWLQSTGYGKTRTVREYSKGNFSIGFNIGNTDMMFVPGVPCLDAWVLVIN